PLRGQLQGKVVDPSSARFLAYSRPFLPINRRTMLSMMLAPCDCAGPSWPARRAEIAARHWRAPLVLGVGECRFAVPWPCSWGRDAPRARGPQGQSVGARPEITRVLDVTDQRQRDQSLLRGRQEVAGEAHTHITVRGLQNT